MSSELGSATSPTIEGTALVLVPVGSCEQHGPHLPLETDTVIADAVTRRAASLLGDGLRTVVAPPVTYGASGEHQAFAGTSSIGTEVLGGVLVELVRSMRTWAQRVVFVNGHGGNLMALRAACTQLIVEGHQTGWVACATEGDAHAGRTETSLMLHLAPDTVRLAEAAAGNTTALRELMPALASGGVRAVSSNGVLGDPTGATAEEGRRILERMAQQVAESVSAGAPDEHGRIRVAQGSAR